MEDSKVTLADRGFVFPWVNTEQQSLDENDYFPPDYPVSDKLVTPAKRGDVQQQNM